MNDELLDEGPGICGAAARGYAELGEERFLSPQADTVHPAESAGWRGGAGANVKRKGVGLLRSK